MGITHEKEKKLKTSSEFYCTNQYHFSATFLLVGAISMLGFPAWVLM